MSALEEIKSLEAQRNKLVAKAKSEALKAANKAVADLNALGFDYKLVEGGKPAPAKPAPRRGPKAGSKRRAGIRKDVLKVVGKAPDGIKRADIITALKIDDQSGKQSVSNALIALKKSGEVTAAGGLYKTA